MMVGVTVTEWRSRGDSHAGKPKLIEFLLSTMYPNSSAALVSLQTANPPKVSPCSIILHHSIQPPSHAPCHNIFLSSRLPLFHCPPPLFQCLDMGRLELPPSVPQAAMNHMEAGDTVTARAS
ncbi:hypothetical protein PBY51_014337 [Eleginops maclovinus]|uniref:Uncharacterized protein n=1 Tax=Eleginops maclovinus TaxID=56733 RepID=A0AAN7WMG0_ELEMC|nr:hypothetical protein PBY51_014337 [Eleginops maclovinus]